MTSLGLNRRTGGTITDDDHIRQSIEDILTTRVASRVLARDYGSDVPNRVDAPMNDRNVLGLFADIYNALRPRAGMFGILGEPRFRLAQIQVVSATATGQIQLALVGVKYPNAHKGDMTPASGTASYLVALSRSA